MIGAIDGTHINIKAPQNDSASYINRKGQHSVVLQAVATAELLFTDCYAGEVGSVHDATVFRRSDLFRRIEADSQSMFPHNSHMLGDAAYPLMTGLMVPFKDTGSLTRRQAKYNRTLSSSRCAIERAFALLKGRFRRLKFLDMSRVDLVPKFIVACCVLHNLCIKHSDLMEDHADDDADDDNVQYDGTAIQSTATVRQLAVAKRNDICAQLA